MHQLFKDTNSQLSMVRLLAFIIVICIMGVWCIVSIINKAMANFSDGSVLVLGIAMGGKATQRMAENLTNIKTQGNHAKNQ